MASLLAVCCVAGFNCSATKTEGTPSGGNSELDIWSVEFTITKNIDDLEESIFEVMEARNRLEQFCEKTKRYPSGNEINEIMSSDRNELTDRYGRIFLARIENREDGGTILDIYTYGVDGKLGGTGKNEDIAYRSEGKPPKGRYCLSSIGKRLQGKNADERKAIYKQILDETFEMNRKEKL